jgi:GNAT superfamily N-acetyltransferase
VNEVDSQQLSMIKPVNTSLTDGKRITIRRLVASDASAFGGFLEGLSDETRRFYRPHALDESEARRICGSIEADSALRLIATTEGTDRIEAYVLTEFVIPEDEKERYADYGIALEDGLDCRIAPSVADGQQNRGLGSMVLSHTIQVLRGLGLRHVVLFGGTQAGNSRAIHVYQKLGFIALGSFQTKGIDNIDMWIPELSSGSDL